jgi:hypothetical protein
MSTHRTSVTAGALAPALALALSFALAGCSSSAATRSETATVSAPTAAATGTSSPAVTATSAAATAAPAAPAVVKGLPSLPDYPLEVTPDPSWVAGATEAGALSYSTSDGVKVISVHPLDSLADTPEADVPADVAAFLRDKRAALSISDERAVTQSGLPAQRFRLAIREGRAATDLWDVRAGSRYKPLEDEPMEVVMVRSSQGLVLLWTEWQPAREAATLAAFDAALERITIR